MSKIRTYQQQVQDALEKGINTVEKQHKSLAERPFKLAEKAEKQAKSYSIKSVRSKHDDYANTAYEALRVWNKRLGDYATNLISRFDKEATPAETAAESAESKPAASKQSSGAKQSGGAKKSTASKKQSTQQASA